jgi:hypothetical protein
VSPLNSIEVINRLNKVIGQEGVVKEYMFGSTPYYGKIVDPHFSATRITATRLFSRGIRFDMPVINGKVQSEAAGSSIDFSISPGNIGKKGVIFYGRIIGLLVIICLAGFIWAAIASRPVEQVISLVIMGIILISYLIQWISFKIEAITYRNDFCKLFNVEIEP